MIVALVSSPHSSSRPNKSRRTLKDDTKRALSDFLAYAVMNADDIGGGRRMCVRHGYLSLVVLAV